MSKIADKVYQQEDIILGEAPDEFEITIRPNPISRQRRFMDIWDVSMKEVEKKAKQLDEAKKKAEKDGKEVDEDDYSVDRYDTYIDLCAIALEKAIKPHLVQEVDGTEKEIPQYDARRKITKEYRAFLEDVLDLETIYKVIEVCGGIKLNDPNLIATMMEMQAEAESSGQI